jgi:hypothetical protein
MPNPYEVVSEINSVLISQTPKSPRELADLATAYAGLCVEANRRLKRCGDFLRHGLRAEAIYHAEVEPDLLDLLATLDLVRINDWNAVCLAQKIEPAQTLLVDVARELNEAYTADSSASQLMKRLRLLSLGEAPVAQRLAVLRSLRQLDPANAVLEKDIREYESVRLREIASEAKCAYEGQDEVRLADLGRELGMGQWVSALPEQLPGSIASCRRKLQVDRAICQLQQILPELHNAYAASSYEECSAMLAQWDEVLVQANIEAPDDLQSQVQPIRDFVGGIEQQRGAEQRFANACGALSLALDEPTGAADLNRLYRDVLSFDQPISDDLAARYRSRIAEIELAHRRKVRLVTVLSIVGVLLAGAGVAVMIDYFITQEVLRKLRREFAASVAAAVSIEDKREGDNGEALEPAKQYCSLEIDKKWPRFTSDAEIAATRQKLDDAIRQREARIQQFNKAMRRLEESGFENPDRGAWDRVNALARSHAEKNSILRWEGEYGNYWREKVDKIAGDLRKKADELEQAVDKELSSDKINGLRQADLDALRRGETDVQRCLANREKEHKDLSNDFADRKASLPEQYQPELEGLIAGRLRVIGMTLGGKDEAIKAIIEMANKGGVEETAVEQVGKAATPEDLAKALKDFPAKCPESRRNADFLRAAEGAANWSCMIELQALARAWTETPLPATAESRKERADAAAAFYKKYPKAPYAKPVGEYMAYLAVVPDNPGDREDWKTLSSGRLVNPLMQVHAFEYLKQTYYCPKGTKPQDRGTLGGWTMKYIPALSTDEADLATITCNDAAVPMPRPTLSAHARLCIKVRGMISDVSAANWDRIGLDIANAVLEYDPAKAETEKVLPVDPIVRVMILEEVLNTAKTCGWGADEQIGGALKTITGLMLKEEPLVLWPNPADDRAKEKRVEAMNALKKIGRMDPLVPAARRDALVRALPGQLFLGQGVLLRLAGKWELRGPGASAMSPGMIVCAAVESGTSGLALQKIADVGPDGKPVFAADGPRVPEGSMVFICKGPDKP